MRSQMKATLAVLALVYGLGAEGAFGSPLLLTFEGVITEVEDFLVDYGYDPLHESIVVGASFSGAFPYDPDTAVDLDPDPAHGEYEIDSSIAGYLASTVPYATSGIHGVDIWNGGTFYLRGVGEGETLCPAGYFVELYLDASSAGALPSDKLPSSIDLDAFLIRNTSAVCGDLCWQRR